jgi:hypothetical protein
MSFELLQAIANRVVPLAFSSGVANLSDADRQFFLAWGYAGELDNGGHIQFFLNTMGDYIPETIVALRELDLPRQADLLHEAAEQVFGNQVPRDIQERNEVVEQMPDDGKLDELLDSLDDRFYSLGGGHAVYEALFRRYCGGGPNDQLVG